MCYLSSSSFPRLGFVVISVSQTAQMLEQQKYLKKRNAERACPHLRGKSLIERSVPNPG